MNSGMVYSILRCEDGRVVIVAKERVEALHHIIGNASLVVDIQGNSFNSRYHFPNRNIV